MKQTDCRVVWRRSLGSVTALVALSVGTPFLSCSMPTTAEMTALRSLVPSENGWAYA